MSRTYRIRDCGRADCPAVLDLWRQAEAIPSQTDTLGDLQRLVDEHGGLFLVAEEAERLVGTIIAGWDGWRGNMYRLAVLPEFRRRGIARFLVAEPSGACGPRGLAASPPSWSRAGKSRWPSGRPSATTTTSAWSAT